MEPVSTILATGAITAGITSVVESLVVAVRQLADASLHASAIRESVPGRVRSLVSTKTILNPEQPRNVVEFFVPPKLSLSTRDSVFDGPRAAGVGFRIDSSADLPGPRVAIRGIAGQGKSCFLKYIAHQDAVKGERLPVLLNLREVKEGEGLREAIHGYLFGATAIDPKLLDGILRSGKLSILLDGFDEVHTDRRADLITQIERLATHHESLVIAITSRPDTEVFYSSIFRNYELMQLDKCDARQVVDKLAFSSDQRISLRKAFEKEVQSTLEALKTPLLCALLVVRYNFGAPVPQHPTAFYDKLFELLLSRHDTFKPGFRRHRCCNLSDSEMQALFGALALHATSKSQLAAPHSVFLDAARASLRALNLPDQEAVRYLEDVVSITCLLLREGDETRFIHKTVAEFYAAEHLSSCPEKKAEAILTHWARQPSTHNNLVSELAFLKEINRYRFERFFGLPVREAMLRHFRSGTVVAKEVYSGAFSVVAGTFIVTPKDHTNSFSLLSVPSFDPQNPLHCFMHSDGLFALLFSRSKDTLVLEVIEHARKALDRLGIGEFEKLNPGDAHLLRMGPAEPWLDENHLVALDRLAARDTETGEDSVFVPFLRDIWASLIKEIAEARSYVEAVEASHEIVLES